MEQGSEVPSNFGLFQNYPNPFNPTTTIRFDLNSASEVTLAIYNVKGQLIRTLIDGNMMPGNHSIVWDGRDNQTTLVPSGLYIAQMNAGGHVLQNKMLLIK